ncbi:hypothetical protein N9X63_00955 [Woeseiaceae bacterium]|jgi:hypothetical protein|nr:hypothetical protein [Woeseiaceae bacterium]
MKKIFFLTLILIFMNSCSFQSMQYDFIKKIVIKESNDARPVKNWTLNWNQKKTYLYAINFQEQIIFADNLINIYFEDNQIYKIIGLFPDNLDLEIKSSDKGLVYFLNKAKVTDDFCEILKVTTENNYKKYSRICYEQISQESYKNKIIINSDGLITNMIFKIHPDYPSLELSMN